MPGEEGDKQPINYISIRCSEGNFGEISKHRDKREGNSGTVVRKELRIVG